MIHIYRYSPCVAAVTTLGISVYLSFFYLEMVIWKVVISCIWIFVTDDDVDVGFSYQLMHCFACFMSSTLLLYFVPCAVRHSTGFRLVHSLLSFLWRPFCASWACVQCTFVGNAGWCGAGRHTWYQSQVA